MFLSARNDTKQDEMSQKMKFWPDKLLVDILVKEMNENLPKKTLRGAWETHQKPFAVVTNKVGRKPKIIEVLWRRIFGRICKSDASNWANGVKGPGIPTNLSREIFKQVNNTPTEHRKPESWPWNTWNSFLLSKWVGFHNKLLSS